MDDLNNAVQTYLIAVEAGLPRESSADASLWQLGLMAEETDQDLLAAEMYARIIEQYPRSVFGTVAQEQIKRIAAKYPSASIQIPELSSIGLGR